MILTQWIRWRTTKETSNINFQTIHTCTHTQTPPHTQVNFKRYITFIRFWKNKGWIFLKVNLNRNSTSLFHLSLLPMRFVNGCWSQYLSKPLLESNIILTVVDANSLSVSSKYSHCPRWWTGHRGSDSTFPSFSQDEKVTPISQPDLKLKDKEAELQTIKNIRLLDFYPILTFAWIVNSLRFVLISNLTH